MTTLTQQPRVPLPLELVAFPLAVSIRQDNRVTVAMLLLLLLSSAMRNPRSREHLNLIPTALLMLCVALVYWRGPFIMAVLFIVATVMLVNTARAVSRATAYASLLAGLSLYLVGNIVGWLVGIKSGSTTVRIGGYETEGGLFGTRIFFPFAQSINESAFVATAMIVAVTAMIMVRQKPQWYHWTGVAAGIVVILASNSRAPILFAAPVLAFILIAPRLTRTVAPFGVAVALVLPFLMEWLRPLVIWVGSLLASSSYFARGQSVREFVGLSSREMIWTRGIDFWGAHVTDGAHQLTGYGFLGHATSGASYAYASGGSSFFSERSAITMHNSVLQTLFDAGLLGMAILFGVTVFTVYRYARDALMLPILAVVLMVGLSGTLEVTLAPGLGQTPVFLLLYLAVFIPVKSASPPAAAPADHAARVALPPGSGDVPRG